MSEQFVIPAAEGTFLITHVELDTTIPSYPIVGWLVGPTGQSFPCMPVGSPKGYVSGQAFMSDRGVFDPVTGEFYADEESWRDAVEENPPYEFGKAPAMAFKNPPVSNATPAGGRTPSQEKAPVKSSEIIWGTKALKNNSFWFYNPADGEAFVFIVKGGNVSPKNAEKITREDFYAKRKEGMTERLGEPDDEPELPLAEDDEDDLI